MTVARFAFLILAAVSCVALSSCDSTPTGPGAFSGHVLKATVNGAAMTFDVGGALDNAMPSYKPADTAGTIFGDVNSGTTRRTLTVFIYTDINKGSFPRVLAKDQVNIVYIENINNAITSYYCSTDRDNCDLTITASSGGVVSGTFSGHLTSNVDTSKHAEVSNGTFSVKFE